MTKRIIVVMMAVGLCAVMAQGDVGVIGDVNPADPGTWTDLTDVFVGNTGVGSAAVDDDSDVVTRSSYMGFLVGSTGVVTVSGAGSTWDSTRSTYVGYRGDGTLEIINGGYVSSFDPSAYDALIGQYPGSTGLVTVSGVGSAWDINQFLYVGLQGSATLEITDGGAVDNSIANIGRYSGSTGAVTVSNSGSTWTNIHLYVGNEGNGTLEITDGGAVSSTRGYIGRSSGSAGEVTVSGVGSIWTGGPLYVGYEGSGTLEVTNGGTVVGGGNIAVSPGSTGTATVSGAGSAWYAGNYVDVGSTEGHGMLRIADGGLVTVGMDLDIRGSSFIKMSTGGMLAFGVNASDSLADFLLRVHGNDDIRYWDDDISDWAHITGATYGEDYTLNYVTEGDLSGYTVLTVTAIPEPATMSLLAFGGLAMLRRRRE